MAPHSSTLAWKIPWTEETGGLQSMGWRRVGHDWATSLSFFTFMHCRRKWQPTPVFLPGESQGGGTWWATVYGVAQSRTRLKRLSSSSSIDPDHWFLFKWHCFESFFLYLRLQDCLLIQLPRSRAWDEDLAAAAAAADAKSLQSCPTLCDPIDGSPLGSPIPRILQARTLEWAAISFSNAWKWKVKVKSDS